MLLVPECRRRGTGVTPRWVLLHSKHSVSPHPSARGQVPSVVVFKWRIRGGNQVTGPNGLGNKWPSYLCPLAVGRAENLCANLAPSAFFTHCPLCCQGQGRHAPLRYLPWLPREKVTHTVLRALGTALSGNGQQQRQKPRLQLSLGNVC